MGKNRAAADGFAEFYAVQFRPVAAQLGVYLGDLDEARDVTQEAFVRAWQRWDRIGGYDEPVTWVRRVAWNLATSRLRRLRLARRHQRVPAVEAVPGPDPRGVTIRSALAALPEGQRRAVVLHYLVDLPVAEVADLCRVREGTVRTWLYRARLALVDILRDITEEPSSAASGPSGARYAVKRPELGGTLAASGPSGARYAVKRPELGGTDGGR